MIKKSRKWFIRELDKLFSRIVRDESAVFYGNCPFCRSRPIQDCFHFVSRRHYITRWDPANAVGSCRSCNGDMRYHPERYWQWYRANRSVEAEDALIAKSRQISDFSNSDLKDMLEQMGKTRG